MVLRIALLFLTVAYATLFAQTESPKPSEPKGVGSISTIDLTTEIVNLTEPPVMVSGAGTRAFTLDLSQPIDPKTQVRVEKAIRTETRGKSLTRNRRRELDLAQGLLMLAKGRHTKAETHFRSAEEDARLVDAALFYRARAVRLSGEQAAFQQDPSQSLKRCRRARQLFGRFLDYLPGPFEELYADEKRKASLCYIRALLRSRRYREAEGPALSMLRQREGLTGEDRRYLFGELVKIRSLRQDPMAARSLLNLAKAEFPWDKGFKAWDRKLPRQEKSRQAEKDSRLRRKKPPLRPEEKLLEEVRLYKKRRRFKKALSTIVDIFDDYPGSKAAQKAKGLLQNLLRKRINQGQRISPYLGDLRDLPPSVAYRTARMLWNADYNSSAYKLFDHVASKHPQTEEAGSSYYILGRMHEDRREWKEAQEMFLKLVEAYSASTFFGAAHFKLGWLAYLNGDYEEAVRWLEADRQQENDPNVKAQPSYWLARAYQKLNRAKEADQLFKEIADLAPLSYYAFLAGHFPPRSTQTELPGKRPDDFWTQYYLRRARALLGAGLPRMAAAELQHIDADGDPNVAKTLSVLFGMAGVHPPAITIAWKLLKKNSQQPLPRHLLKSFFPLDFQKEVLAESKKQKIDPLLIFSLIKQESAYREDATSRTGALGLMQLMPSTAEGLVDRKKEKKPGRDELLRSETNIRLGVRYLAELINQQDGNLVYALAAYNGGPHRVKTWRKRWGSLPGEVFVELIPFPETRNYVKRILRNYAYYSGFLQNRILTPDRLLPGFGS